MRGVVHRGSATLARIVPWQLRAGQVLEEHHLCASSDNLRQRERFVLELGSLLAQLDDSHVCTLDGDRIHDLTGLCREMERGLGVGRIERSIDGPDGLVEAIEDPGAQFCLGVEWHPELLWDSEPRHRGLFRGLTAAAAAPGATAT